MRALWAVVAVISLAGCDQIQGQWEQRGGGGGAATRQSSAAADLHGQNPQLARDLLGDALVSAARLHQGLVAGRQDGSRAAMRELRRKLAEASLYAAIDQQSRINQLEASAIEIEGFMQRQAPEAVGASSTLLLSLLSSFDALASVPAPNGGGGGPAATAPEAAEEAPMPIETFGPPAPYNELDPDHLLEQRP